jgi:hypothetical protein
MILDWQIQVIEPGSSVPAADQLRTLLSLGPAARRALAGMAPGTKLTLRGYWVAISKPFVLGCAISSSTERNCFVIPRVP